MKLKQIKAGKTLKIGLTNYSSIDVGFEMTFEVAEGEKIDYDQMWDKINQQLSIQGGHFDPAWLETKKFKEFIKIILKIPNTSLLKKKAIDK